jgi:hypothetical protein
MSLGHATRTVSPGLLIQREGASSTDRCFTMSAKYALEKVGLHDRSHNDPLPRVKSLEWFRVKPRWLFVKIVDDSDGYGWGEATLEGHDKAVEGALSEMADRLIGYVAEWVKP